MWHRWLRLLPTPPAPTSIYSLATPVPDPGQCRRDASICRCVAPLSNAATSSLPLPPPPSTAALSAYASTNPNPKLPPNINYGSSPLSLPEMFSTHRTLAAPAPPPLHVFKLKIIIISAASLSCCPPAPELPHPSEYSVSAPPAHVLRHRASPQFAPTPPTLPAATPIALGYPSAPDRHPPRLSSLLPVLASPSAAPQVRHRRGARPTDPHKPATSSITQFRPQTRDSARAQSKYPTQFHSHPQRAAPPSPALHAAPPPTHTSRLFPSTIPPAARRRPPRTPRRDMQHLPHAHGAPRSLFIAGAGLFASSRRLSRSTAAPRSTPRCRPLQRDAQHHSQRQRTPPSFAIAAAAIAGHARSSRLNGVPSTCGIVHAAFVTSPSTATISSPAQPSARYLTLSRPTYTTYGAGHMCSGQSRWPPPAVALPLACAASAPTTPCHRLPLRQHAPRRLPIAGFCCDDPQRDDAAARERHTGDTATSRSERAAASAAAPEFDIRTRHVFPSSREQAARRKETPPFPLPHATFFVFRVATIFSPSTDFARGRRVDDAEDAE
ncbi:hypothetical protein DFH09DRAFT_1382444 [Mycena vulgaris]|nr:hypothetical protein DFH09DRAFT_1382444 [Mycena vulgaris]